jgi:hypothetical protein
MPTNAQASPILTNARLVKAVINITSGCENKVAKSLIGQEPVGEKRKSNFNQGHVHSVISLIMFPLLKEGVFRKSCLIGLKP